MLIDWTTAYLPMDRIPVEHWQKLRSLTERVIRFKPESGQHAAFVHGDTGEVLNEQGYILLNRDSVVYETAAWESVRSDSHQIAFRVGSDAVWIQGSPARVCGSGDAVFGEGAAAAVDLGACVLRMAAFVATKFDVPLSNNVTDWTVTRIDITGNLILDDLAQVREALRVLRNCEGGRYRVSQQAGDTVYWSHQSRLRSGKSYAKGPHIEYQIKRLDYNGRKYTITELENIHRLLRLELRLGAQWIRERAGCAWHQLTRDQLIREWREYFERMIGSADMMTNDEMKERIIAAAKTKGQGMAAYRLYLYIRSEGWEKARSEHSRATWFRYLKNLRDAGLGDADIAAGNIVPLRRKILECQLVNCWGDIRNIAA